MASAVMLRAMMHDPTQSRVLLWLTGAWVVASLPAVLLGRGFGLAADPGLLLLAIAACVVARGRVAQAWRDARWLIIGCAALLASYLIAALAHREFSFEITKSLRLIIVPMALIVVGVFAPPRWTLAASSILAIAILSGYAIRDVFIAGLDRAHGYTVATVLGSIAVLLGAIAVSLAFDRGLPRALRIVLAITTLLALGVATLAVARGAWFAALAYGFPIVAALRASGSRSFNAIVVAMVVLSIASIGWVGRQRIEKAAEEIQQLALGHYQPGSLYFRASMWRAAAEMFASAPLTGIGRNAWGPTLDARVKRGELPPVDNLYHAHNDLLDASATRGVIGAIGLLVFYVCAFAWFWRRVAARTFDPMPLAGLAVIGVALLAGFTDAFLYSKHSFYPFVWAVGLVAGFCLVDREAAR